MCLCSLLLCCAGTAIGQSVSGNASDAAGATVNASPESASASSVDAIADSAVVAATRGGSAYRSESGLGSLHANMALARAKSGINADRLSRSGAKPTSSSGDLSRRARASTPKERGASAASTNGVPPRGGTKGPGTGVQGAGTGMEGVKTVVGSSTDDERAFSYSRIFLTVPKELRCSALLIREPRVHLTGAPSSVFRFRTSRNASFLCQACMWVDTLSKHPRPNAISCSAPAQNQRTNRRPHRYRMRIRRLIQISSSRVSWASHL